MTEISGAGEKGCPRCEEVKPLTAFYVWKGKPVSFCRACQCRRAKVRRAAGLVQEADRRRYHAPDGRVRAKVLAQTAQWKARNRDKVHVHYLVERAIEQGALVRQPCEVCGERAHAHHADYGKPLEVQWLCPLHHARQHAAEGRLAR